MRAPPVPRHSWLGCAVWVCVLGLGLRLRPATPGWGVGVCVCLCARFACTLPFLAGVCVLGLGFWLRPATPGWGVRVCAFVCALRLYPTTPGWGVWCGCVCSGLGLGCALPLLAGVLGFVCVCVRAPLVPHHSWLGCAVWVWVLGLGFRLRPATPGWGVGVCVCSCVRSTCTPPLLARVCGVGVCAWSRVSAAPRHSWLECWGVCDCACALLVPRRSRLGFAVWACVLGLQFCLRPATPGWGVRCGCVCLSSGFRMRPATPGWGVGVYVCSCVLSACTPPLLAGVCGLGVCAGAPVSAGPRLDWLGCWGVRVGVRAPLAPRHSWLGCACLGSGFGCAPPFLTGVFGFVCGCVRAPLVPRHSWLGCAMWVCVLWLGSACAPPLLAGVLGPVCACVPAALVPRHSWLACAVCMCAFGLGLRLRPATPAWGVGVCVCLCAHPARTPPFLAGLCGVGVCAWARVSAAPRHSWLGCWGVRACVRAPLVPRHSWLGCAVWVCVLGLGFQLRPATPGWGFGFCVCLCARSACTPPLLAGVCGVGVCARRLGSGCAPPLLAGVLGPVCACVPAPLVPRHSWLGCTVCMCAFGLRNRLSPTTPGWDVGVCVCLCVHPACTPPLLAGLCGVGVCAWDWVSPAPRHSWLGSWGVCVLVCELRLYPATPGWGVRFGCVCLGSGFGRAPPLLVRVLGFVCVCVRAPLVPRHSLLGCAMWACVLGLRFPLRPATPGWGVGVCVSLCVRSAYTPQLLAWCAIWVCVLGLCFQLRPATPGWGFGGCVCLCGAPLVPRHSWLGCAVLVCVLGLGFRLRPATPGWGVGLCVLVCALRLYPATPCWGVRAWARVWAKRRHPRLVCWGVRDCVRALPVPRHSWPGCAVSLCVLRIGFRLRPATPPSGVRVGVCLCARSACTPPLLAGMCGVGVCAWARASAAPRSL